MLDAAHREAAHSERVAALLAQNAAVRAADALCVRALGYHSQGDDHGQAVAVLKTVRDGPALAKRLQAVLTDKTEVGYDITPVKPGRLDRILRNADALVHEAVSRSRE